MGTQYYEFILAGAILKKKSISNRMDSDHSSTTESSAMLSYTIDDR